MVEFSVLSGSRDPGVWVLGYPPPSPGVPPIYGAGALFLINGLIGAARAGARGGSDGPPHGTAIVIALSDYRRIDPVRWYRAG